MTNTPLPTIGERAEQVAQGFERYLVPTARVLARALRLLATASLVAGAGAALAAWLGRDTDTVRIAAIVTAALAAVITWLALLQSAAVRELQHLPGHVRGVATDLPARVDELAQACERTNRGGLFSRARAAVQVRSLCDELQGPFSDWNVLARLASPLRWGTLGLAALLVPFVLVVAVPLLLLLAI